MTRTTKRKGKFIVFKNAVVGFEKRTEARKKCGEESERVIE
jgi:hypothetical protein